VVDGPERTMASQIAESTMRLELSVWFWYSPMCLSNSIQLELDRAIVTETRLLTMRCLTCFVSLSIVSIGRWPSQLRILGFLQSQEKKEFFKKGKKKRQEQQRLIFPCWGTFSPWRLRQWPNFTSSNMGLLFRLRYVLDASSPASYLGL